MIDPFKPKNPPPEMTGQIFIQAMLPFALVRYRGRLKA
jgi:hypothetical protein